MHHVNCDTIALTHAEVRALVDGKFQPRQCTHCYGKGWFWVHEDGTVRNPQQGENEDAFYQHQCGDEECGGIGFNLHFNDEDLEKYER